MSLIIFAVFALLYRYELAIVVEATVGMTTSWRHIDGDQADGDHGVMPVLWRWRSKAQDDDGHIMSHIELHVMLILLCILFCIGRRKHYKMIRSLNFKISVLPWYAPLRRFDASKHHVMIGCDRFFVRIQRV